MASKEGFLTDEQREILKVASLNLDVLSSSTKGLSSSPKSPSAFLSDHQLKVSAPWKASTTGLSMKNVRRSNSGKFGRPKKDVRFINARGMMNDRMRHTHVRRLPKLIFYILYTEELDKTEVQWQQME